jgi:iron(III) transport system substrate-binding protein
MKKLIVLLLVLCVATPAFAADLAKAKAEGKANFYANITAVEPIMEAFNKSQGVEGIYTRISTSKYLATVWTEFDVGKLTADVLQAPMPIMEILKDRGVFTPYRSPSDVPRSYMDLTDPKWKDKIVMPNPSTHATTISWLVGLKEAKIFASDDEWMKFVKGLAANRPMFVASFGPSPGPIESGEKLVGISMPKYIITHAPAPLDWVRVDTILGTPRGIAIAAKAPHPEAGRLFMDYWLSREAMQLLADRVGEYVLAPGVYPPIEGISKAKIVPIRSMTDDEIKSWGEKFKAIFEM